MDSELQEPLKKTRLVAWLAAGLLAAGVVSVGMVSAENEAAERRLVSAAGQGADGVELPTTVAEFVPPAPPPPSVPPTTTAAAAPTTTAAPAPRPTLPPTTQAPRPTTTTTARPAPTSPTTAAAAPAGVMLSALNGHPMAVVVKVNDQTFTLAPNQRVGPVAVNRYAHGNDIVEVSLSQDPECGTGDADIYFPTPGSYELTVAPPLAGGGCGAGVPGVGFVVRKG